jgi:hypothetical protein
VAGLSSAMAEAPAGYVVSVCSLLHSRGSVLVGKIARQLALNNLEY